MGNVGTREAGESNKQVLVSRDQVHLPVKYLALNATLESVQGDVVLHEGFHFLLVCHEKRGIKCPTAFGYSETNDATTSTEF